MSKKIFALVFLIVASSRAFLQAQHPQQTVGQPNTQPAPTEESAISETTEGRVFDEGQVQVPREGQVESSPEGHVEAINPTGYQPPTQDTQPDLFRFESRLFNPIPSDE